MEPRVVGNRPARKYLRLFCFGGAELPGDSSGHPPEPSCLAISEPKTPDEFPSECCFLSPKGAPGTWLLRNFPGQRRTGFHRPGHRQTERTSRRVAGHPGGGPGTQSAQLPSGRHAALHRRQAAHSAVAHLQRSHASTRCSTWSRRAKTPSASAAAPRATRATRAALLESLRLELGLGLDEDEEPSDADKLIADHARPQIHGAHRGLLRAMRPGAGGGDQPPHLRTRERAHPAARSATRSERENELMPRIEDIGVFNAVREAGMAKLVPPVPRIAVGMGTCGRGNGAEGLYHAFAEAIERSGTDSSSPASGCFGACFQEPLVNVRMPGQPAADSAPRAGQRCGAHSARPGRRQQSPPDLRLLQDRGVGPHHRLDPLRPRLSRNSARGTKCRSSRARRRSCCATAA